MMLQEYEEYRVKWLMAVNNFLTEFLMSVCVWCLQENARDSSSSLTSMFYFLFIKRTLKEHNFILFYISVKISHFSPKSDKC